MQGKTHRLGSIYLKDIEIGAMLWIRTSMGKSRTIMLIVWHLIFCRVHWR